MSHDAITILVVLVSVAAMVSLWKLANKVIEFLLTLRKLSEAVISLDAQMKEFIPRYLAQGEPLAAVPNILKAHVGGLLDLKDTIQQFSKIIIGNSTGGHIEPDERKEAREDEIIRLQEAASARGQQITREEAIERIDSRNLWSRMSTIVPTGSDD